MSDGPGPARPPDPDAPRHPAPVFEPRDFPGGDIPQPQVFSFQMRRAPGPLGCLLGALGAAVFLVLAVVLLIAGGLFFLLGGRRIAAALFRRAMNRRFSAQQQSWPQPQNDPEVIDVEAEEILDARDQE